MNHGATFSEPYALSLALDPPAALRAITQDVRLSLIRLCAYWDRIEPQPGRFDFRSLDWQFHEAARAGLDIILTVGQKAPRWPEYHRPAWAPPEISRLRAPPPARFIEVTVRRFRDAPVTVWQVENEPYITFGGPRIDETLLRREIDLVGSLDARPVMVTESAGERDWRRSTRWCDILGVNLTPAYGGAVGRTSSSEGTWTSQRLLRATTRA